MPPANIGTIGRLSRVDYALELRQNPEIAKVCAGGKGKDRKPIDPPPVVGLKIHDPNDPAQNYLQSPYYFMMCSLWDAEEDKPVTTEDTDPPLCGCLSSSLHRLKEPNNTDVGFFVFGDISVKIEGRFRLRFVLFEILDGAVISLNEIISSQFHTYPTKGFPGMRESTFLSRSIADQGVRIRIRKESNRKRPRSRGNQADVNNTPTTANNYPIVAQPQPQPPQIPGPYDQEGYPPARRPRYSITTSPSQNYVQQPEQSYVQRPEQGYAQRPEHGYEQRPEQNYDPRYEQNYGQQPRAFYAPYPQHGMLPPPQHPPPDNNGWSGKPPDNNGWSGKTPDNNGWSGKPPDTSNGWSGSRQ